MDGISPNLFKGVHMNMNGIAIVEDLLTPNILLYDIDNVDENSLGGNAIRSVQKYTKTVRQLRDNNHTFYVSKIKAVFQYFCCSNSGTFFRGTFN